MTAYQLIHNDILTWASSYEGPKFHALFCDPPYHLTSITKRFGKDNSAPAKTGIYNRGSKGFMGQQWDGGELAFAPETWQALTQHLYPGGFIMAFAGTRGYHRMAVAMEDAGLIVHPAMIWVFLSGFPKATRIDTQVDREAGVEREIIRPRTYELKNDGGYSGGLNTTKPRSESCEISEPATPLAKIWQSHRYGLQALKPSLEFIAIAQKPYQGRPVDNIVETGAGSLNIDGGRIPTDELTGWGGHPSDGYSGGLDSYEEGGRPVNGRWPANLILSEEGAELLDRQSGENVGSHGRSDREYNLHSWMSEKIALPIEKDDSGGASRMFHQTNWSYEILEQLETADPLKYEPKVSTTEREAGLDSLPLSTRNRVNSGGYENDPKFAPTKMKNHHPTLKPISLTKYLATLLLPPDAYAPRRLLIPFAGTGSEMIGALLAGWDEVTGIEKGEEYHKIGLKRLEWWTQWLKWGQTDVDTILASIEKKDEEEGKQLDFFNL